MEWFKPFFSHPVWQQTARDPLALKASADLTVQSRRIKEDRLVARIKREIRQEDEMQK